MKRKLFLLVLCLFLITGCSDSIEYKVDMGSEATSIKELIESGREEEPGEESENESENELPGSSDKIVVQCRKNSFIDGLSSETLYKIAAYGDYVETISIAEIKTFQDLTTMNQKLIELRNKETLYQNLDYYVYSVSESENSILEISELNYAKIDVNRISELQPEMAQVLINGQLKLSDAKTVYQQLGAVCE